MKLTAARTMVASSQPGFFNLGQRQYSLMPSVILANEKPKTIVIKALRAMDLFGGALEVSKLKRSGPCIDRICCRKEYPTSLQLLATSDGPPKAFEGL